MRGPLISVVIPTRKGESVTTTVHSLMQQTIQDLELLTIVDHDGRGAPWARNRGAEIARGEYLLFSDNDIDWVPDALDQLVIALISAPDEVSDSAGRSWRVGYAYGAYEMAGRLFCAEPWSFQILQGRNLVSTMALMKRGCFPGWDESLGRLQDWELWLRMALQQRVCGVQVPKVLFRTEVRAGISFDGRCSYEDAWATIRRKHGLPTEVHA